MSETRSRCAALVRYFDGDRPCAWHAANGSDLCGQHERQRQRAIANAPIYKAIVCHCCGETPAQRLRPPARFEWHCACPSLPMHTRNQALEIARLLDLVKQKNAQLDALHFVWCSGTCDGGTHRYGGELTEEIVVEAERNTRRLRERWENMKAKRAP